MGSENFRNNRVIYILIQRADYAEFLLLTLLVEGLGYLRPKQLLLSDFCRSSLVNGKHPLKSFLALHGIKFTAPFGLLLFIYCGGRAGRGGNESTLFGKPVR